MVNQRGSELKEEAEDSQCPAPGEDPLVFNGRPWRGNGLRLAHSFGVYPTALRDTVITVGDDAFLFCVGRHIAIYNHAHDRYSFLPRDATNRMITAAAKSDGTRGEGQYLLAVAERVGEEAQISILMLPKVDGLASSSPAGGDSRGEKSFDTGKVLVPGNKGTDIIGLCFTKDMKHLVSLSAAPESRITYWRWEVEKPMAFHDIKLPVTRICINPQNSSQLSISGKEYFRLWDYNPNDHKLSESPSLFSLKQEKQMNIVDHCWVVSQYLCAASDDGHVHLFEDGEHQLDLDVREVITRDEFAQRAEEDKRKKMLQDIGVGAAAGVNGGPAPVCLLSLASWGRGFVVGGSHGYLGVFKVDAKMQVEPFGTFRMPGEDASLWQMSAGSEDTSLAILSFTEREEEDDELPTRASRSGSSRADRGALARPPVPSILPEIPLKTRCWSLTTFPVGQADSAAQGQCETFTPVFELGTHQGAVLSMASATNRRTLVTSGKDFAVKVWGYPSESQRDASGAFTSELSIPVCNYRQPKSISIHPMGFQVAVVLNDELRLYHLTTPHTTKTLFELPLKNPGYVTYSHSGHMLAVSAGIDVILLDPWKTTLIHLFTGAAGHLSPVNQVAFRDDDAVLLSCSGSPHGAIYGWDLESDNKDKVFEHVSKPTNYKCIVHDLRSGMLAACTAEGAISIIASSGSTVLQLPADGYSALCLAARIGALFVGTRSGSVRAFRWPMKLEGGADANPFAEFPLHAHRVTSLSLSCDLQLLFTACEGGAVLTSDIDIFEKGELVQKNEIALHRQNVQFRYREDASSRQRKNREDQRKANEIHRKLEKSVSAVSASQAKLDEFIMVPKTFFNERLAEIKELEERMKNLKTENEYKMGRQQEEIEEKLSNIGIERKHQNSTAEDKYCELFDDLTKGRERHEDESRQANAMFDARTKELEGQFDDRISKEYDKQSRLLAELQSIRDQHEAEKHDMEDQQENLLEEMRRKNQKHMEDWKQKYDSVCNLLKSDGLKFEEAIIQQGSEYEEQIVEILEHKRVALDMESERSKMARKDGVNMTQVITLLQTEVNAKQTQLREALEERDSLQKKLAESKEICAKVKEQLKERERGDRVKDETLIKLREKMKYLECFRFVLFHKVRSLEEERDPLEEQVNSLKTSVREMYGEFVREFRDKQELGQKLSEKSGLSHSLQTENVDLRAQLAQLKKDGRRLFQDVEQVLHAEDTAGFEGMPKALREICKKHKGTAQWTAPPRDEMSEMLVKPAPKNPDGEGGEAAKDQADAAGDPSGALLEEMMTQRDLLFRKNQIAMGAANHTKQNCAQDLRRLTSENAQLIAEMNTLRTERKAWQRSCKELESKLMASNAAMKANGGLNRAASAPDFDPTGRQGAGSPSPASRTAARKGASADTPYIRRKAVDQQDIYRRKGKAAMSQLPPVPASAGQGRMSPGPGRPSAHEKQFQQSMDSVQAGRTQMERQGFDTKRLSEEARRASSQTLPLERPPAIAESSEGEQDAGDVGSFAAQESIQAS